MAISNSHACDSNDLMFRPTFMMRRNVLAKKTWHPGGDSPSLALYADSQKRHQPIPRYAWPWTLEPVTDPTTDRSGNADEDDPAERGCSRLKKTVVGLTSTTPGRSRMTASLGGRQGAIYDPSPVKRSS